MSIEGKTKAKRNRNSYGLESIIGNIKNGSNYGSVKGYAQLAYYIQQEMEKEEYTSQDLSSNLYLNGLKEESSPLMEYVNTADDEGLLFCCIDQCRKITFAKKPKGAFLWLGNSYFALGRVLHQRHPQEFNATTKERSQKVLDSTSSQRKELLEEIFRQARDCFEKACSENKGNATEYEVMIRMQGESSFWLYKHSHKLEDVANAKKCLRVVEDLGNSTIQNKEYLAITYLEMGKRSEHGFLKEALKRLDALQEQKKKERIRLRAEDFSYRGRCKLYLGRKGSPEYILGAIEDLKTSINLDRQEPHHYSLLADAYLCRARMISDQKPAGMWGMWARLKRQFIKDNALFSYLQEAKNNIEKAIEKAKNHGNVQTFHYCLEGLAADFAEWAGKQGFKVPCFEDQFHYWKEGMEIYLKKTAIEGSEHRIQGPEGEYDLLGNIFLLKKGTRAALEIEKKNTLIIASRLKKRDKKAGIKYFVPISLGIYSEKDNVYYAMRRSKGETLLTLLERNDKNIPLESVAEYLAFIHATLPADPVKKPASSSAEKALTPLVEKEIISQEELSEILHSYSPIDTIMKKAIFVFNKDAHPGNWVLTPEGKITAIDFDERSPIPQTYDLAKLCEHTSQITWEQKEKVIQRYITSYNNYTRGLKIRNHEEFIEEYLHSTLQKAFQFTRGWGENQEKSFYALKSLENALKAIGLIQEKSADPSYKQLEKSLFKIYQKFSGADEYRLASQASNDDKIRQDGSA